jgi:hypothetical protein
MGVACSTYGEEESACRVLVEKLEAKKPLRRHRPRWRMVFGWIFRKCDVEAWTD